MMFSEDYVQSMVTARDAAALVQDVERIRVVHERFAAVPARHWWQRLAEARAQAAARARRARAAADGGAARAAAPGAGTPSAAAPATVEGARAAGENERALAGSRR
jgi:hypothetical protein